MKRPRTSLVAFIAVLLVGDGVAQAADPTIAECLAASDASLESSTAHKLRAERSQLLVCAAASCPAAIRQDCMGHMEEVNAQIPTIVFWAKDSSDGDLIAVKVTMDGEVLAERLEGPPLDVDPGEHTFTFEAAGQPPVTKKLLIQQSQKDRREVITFAAPTKAPMAAPAPTTPPPAPTPTPEQVPPASSPPGAKTSRGLVTQKTLAFMAGGVGVVGLGVGAAFGLMASSQKNDAMAVCPTNPCSTQDGANKWNTAASTGNISTIAFVIGGVGVAGAAVLWFTARSSRDGAITQAGVGPGILQLRGTW